MPVLCSGCFLALELKVLARQELNPLESFRNGFPIL
jgi:hypothetical protein